MSAGLVLYLRARMKASQASLSQSVHWSRGKEATRENSGTTAQVHNAFTPRRKTCGGGGMIMGKRARIDAARSAEVRPSQARTHGHFPRALVWLARTTQRPAAAGRILSYSPAN